MQRYTAILRTLSGQSTRVEFDAYGRPSAADALYAAGPRWARAQVVSIAPMVRS